MNVLLRLSIITVIVLIQTTSNAQFLKPGIELGAGLSALVYQGDLTPTFTGSFKTAGPGLMVYAGKKLNRTFSLRANLAFGKTSGDDGKFSEPSWKQQRNFAFNATIFEVSGLLVWDILGRYTRKRENLYFSPYFYGGLGLSFLNIHRTAAAFNQEFFAGEPRVIAGLTADLSQILPKAMPVLPLGAGVKFILNQKISFFAETAYRLTSTDYLDGFSEAANPAKRDQYGSYSTGIIFNFGSREKLNCPPVPK